MLMETRSHDIARSRKSRARRPSVQSVSLIISYVITSAPLYLMPRNHHLGAVTRGDSSETKTARLNPSVRSLRSLRSVSAFISCGRANFLSPFARQFRIYAGNNQKKDCRNRERFRCVSRACCSLFLYTHVSSDSI